MGWAEKRDGLGSSVWDWDEICGQKDKCRGGESRGLKLDAELRAGFGAVVCRCWGMRRVARRWWLGTEAGREMAGSGWLALARGLPLLVDGWGKAQGGQPRGKGQLRTASADAHKRVLRPRTTAMGGYCGRSVRWSRWADRRPPRAPMAAPGSESESRGSVLCCAPRRAPTVEDSGLASSSITQPNCART